MEFCSLFSGSSGNCSMIRYKGTTILCDSGRSGKQVENSLIEVGAYGEEIDAILITHEHTDHMASAGILSRRFDVPIYATMGTWEGLHAQRIGKIKPENKITIEKHKPFCIKDLQIEAFATSHDAAEPVGYKISDGSSALGIATDTGYITADMDKYLNGCDLVLLESNHDTAMLRTGPYPYHLKKRIQGSKGHLSNDAAAEFAAKLVEEKGVERIVLGHLSQENNLPYLAELATKSVFNEHLIKAGKDVKLEIALRSKISSLHRF